MDKPVCRLCGGRHWSSEAHKFSDSVREGGPDISSKADESPAARLKSPKAAKPDSGGGGNARAAHPKVAQKSVALTKAEYDELVADAEKWRKLREKRRRYMRERRAKR